METFQNDVFISHASEDKVLVARPLAVALESRGYSVWLDENRLAIGDRVTPGIRRYEPLLADRVAATTNNGIQSLADELSEVMRAWSESAPSPAPILADTLTLARLAEAMREQDESFRAVSAVLRTRHEAIKQAIRELA